MDPSSDTLDRYLAASESLMASYPAQCFDDSTWRSGSVGVTDRRILWVSPEGDMVTIRYAAVSSMRSRTLRTGSSLTADYRLLLGGGCVLAVAGGVGSIAFASMMLVPFLLLTGVGALVAAAYLRRFRNGSPWTWMAAPQAVGEVRPWIPDVDHHLPEGMDLDHILLFGSVIVALGSFIGIVWVAPSLSVIIATVVLVAGLGLIDFAIRHQDEWNVTSLVRHRAREIEFGTEDGRSMSIRCDQSESIDRELSRAVFAETDQGGPVGVTGA